MAWPILKNHRTSLSEGIETIVIQITREDEFADLTTAFNRGGRHGAVEWLLAQLHRSTEIDRVCGVDMSGNNIVLRLRQPGKQLEAFIGEAAPWSQLLIEPDVSFATGEPLGFVVCKHSTTGVEWVGKISNEALDRKPFTQDNPPYWQKEKNADDTNLGTD